MFKIFAAAAHREPNFIGRIDGIAPMGFGAIVSEPLTMQISAWGGERSTEAMLVHGLLHATIDPFAYSDKPSFSIIVKNAGTRKYSEEFIPKWLTAPRNTGKDNFAQWKDFSLQLQLGNIEFRKSKDHTETLLLKKAILLANTNAEEAFRAFNLSRDSFSEPGLKTLIKESSATLEEILGTLPN